MGAVAELLVEEGDFEGVFGGELTGGGLLEGIEVGVEGRLNLVEGAEFAGEVFSGGVVVGEVFEVFGVLRDSVGVVAGGGVESGGVDEEGAAGGVGFGGLGEEGGGFGEIAGVGLGGGEVFDDVVAAGVGVVEGVEGGDGGANLAVGELLVGGIEGGGDLGIAGAGGGAGVVFLAAGEGEDGQGQREAGEKGGLHFGGQRGFVSGNGIAPAKAGRPQGREQRRRGWCQAVIPLQWQRSVPRLNLKCIF